VRQEVEAAAVALTSASQMTEPTGIRSMRCRARNPVRPSRQPMTRRAHTLAFPYRSRRIPIAETVRRKTGQADRGAACFTASRSGVRRRSIRHECIRTARKVYDGLDVNAALGSSSWPWVSEVKGSAGMQDRAAVRLRRHSEAAMPVSRRLGPIEVGPVAGRVRNFRTRLRIVPRPGANHALMQDDGRSICMHANAPRSHRVSSPPPGNRW
jgi:hypothetical protein